MSLVRPVQAGDLEEVVALVRAVLAEFGLVFGTGSKTDEELLGLPASYGGAGGAFWVAIDDGGRIVGTAGVFPVAPETYELRKMYLLPGARRTGLGRRLLDECVAWARAAGGEALVLDTTEQMTAAIAFYERNGFTRDDGQIRGQRCTRGYARRL